MTLGRPNDAGSRLEIIAAGLACTVQDLGRPGHAHEGVPPSGAADAASHRLANRLVGNDETDATLEATLGGLVVRLAGGGPARAVALTGAPAPLRVAGRPAPLYAPVAVRPGEVVELGTPAHGLRSYLAVAGGVDAAAELGSRSTDVLSGLGPPPLAAGDTIPLGRPPAAAAAAADVAPARGGGRRGATTLAVVAGPRDDRLGPGGWELLLATTWIAASTSNRIGVRLDGPALATVAGELPPEGVVTGAVQVPPSGRPVVFLADHPVTGGYPVVAVLADDEAVAAAAQIRPGQQVRFRRAGASPTRSSGGWQ